MHQEACWGWVGFSMGIIRYIKGLLPEWLIKDLAIITRVAGYILAIMIVIVEVWPSYYRLFEQPVRELIGMTTVIEKLEKQQAKIGEIVDRVQVLEHGMFVYCDNPMRGQRTNMDAKRNESRNDGCVCEFDFQL